MSQVPQRFEGVAAAVKANIFFDGKVVSHAVFFPDGTKKSLGLIYPGSFRFDTAASERMEITAGSCLARIAGAPEWKEYRAGSSFDVPANSFFEVKVERGITEYVCSFGV